MKRQVELVFFFLFLLLNLSSCSASSKEKPIVVITASYNNAEWFKKNLDSIFMQKYSNFRVIYIEDATPDNVGKEIQQYIKQRGQEGRVTFLQNTTRRGAGANVYRAVWLCEPDEIVAILDGDDWFAHENVLKKLNSVYADPQVWVTYGQFVYYPCGTPGWAAQLPEEIIQQNAYRDYNWVTTALRTFYAGLYQKIHKEDLLYQGDFFPMAGDLAYMWPILEMAGRHSRFIPEVLYVYNMETGINDIQKDPVTQQNLGFITRERKRYQPIRTPY